MSLARAQHMLLDKRSWKERRWAMGVWAGIWALGKSLNLSGYQFPILQSKTTGLNLPVSSEMWWSMVYQAFVLTLVLLQILPAPTTQNMPKTRIRFWESLKVLMPLSRVAPNPGLSTSHSLCLSWNISMLEISNNLIHLRFRVEKRNTIEIN